jgi:hypothetical protein
MPRCLQTSAKHDQEIPNPTMPHVPHCSSLHAALNVRRENAAQTLPVTVRKLSIKFPALAPMPHNRERQTCVETIRATVYVPRTEIPSRLNASDCTIIYTLFHSICLQFERWLTAHHSKPLNAYKLSSNARTFNR